MKTFYIDQKRKRMQSGLTRQQASSAAAREVVKLFAKDNDIGIEALNAQIDELRNDITLMPSTIF